MKKFFKSPDEAKQSDAKSLTKILKKVFSKGVEGSKFFYKAEFEYDNGEVAPFMYIGPPAGQWKKFIKDCKKDKDFVAGVCKLDDVDGDKKFLMEAQMGKGSKAMFLKAVNKQLMKRNNVKAEFVESLPVQLEEEEEDATATAEAPALSAQEMAASISDISTNFKAIREDHNPDQIDNLIDNLADWIDSYKALPANQKESMAKQAEQAKKINAFLQKINQIDSKIDSLMEKIYPLIEQFLEMADHSTDEAQALKAKVERSIVKVETLAAKINDNDFIEACQKFREILAD